MSNLLDKITLTKESSSEDIKEKFKYENSLIESDVLKNVSVKKTISEEELKKYTEEFSPYPIFLYAYLQGASDIDFVAYPFANWKYNDNTRVRLKIDWAWSEEFEFHREVHNQYINALKNWAIKWSWNAKTENQKMPQDGKWILHILNNNKEIEKTIQLRLAFAPQHFTDSKWTPLENCVIRLLDNQWNPKLEEAWFNLFDFEKVKKLQSLKKWLILISWPTWSWKSSTLFWFIDKINDWTRNIFTLENPVEFDVPGIKQFDVQPIEDISDDDEVTFNFTRSESFLMRAAPDVILVWEMRSYQTAKTAINMWLTWHLVLWTLHTNSAIDTLQRLFSFKSKDWDKLDKLSIIDSLEYVSAQMLSPKLCPHCKIKVKELSKYTKTSDTLLNEKNEELLEEINVQRYLAKKNLLRNNIKLILWTKNLSEELIDAWIDESYVVNYSWCDKCTVRKKDEHWILLPPGERVGRKWRLMINETIWFDNYLKNLLISDKYSMSQISKILIDERPLLVTSDTNSIKNKEQHFLTLYQDWLFKSILPQKYVDKLVPWAKANSLSILDAKKYWFKEI